MTDYWLPPHERDKLISLVADQPGQTIEEHEAAAKISDRYMVRVGLVTLVNACQVRRDDNGRIWPTS